MKYRILFILLLFCKFGMAEVADTVLRNGTFITLEKDQPQATALAIRGERIAWIGDEKEVQKLVGKETKVIDLRGAFAYPGLIDSHAHIVSLGASRLEIDLNETRDKDSIVRLVKERLDQARPGEWIEGRGWDQNNWPVKQFPTAGDIDGVSPNNPVVLERTDGHAIWVNTKAMQIAGITAATKDPEGGKIIRDANNNPTGVLVDNAGDVVYGKMPEPSTKQLIKQTKIALNESAAKGVTMIQDAGSNKNEIEAFKTLAAKNDLPIRLYVMVAMRGDYGQEFVKTGQQHNGPYLDVRSIKLVIDGAMGSRGAAFLEPYSDDPGNTGLLMWQEPELMRVLKAAKTKGIQVCIHAIGDRANRIVLDAYEKTGVGNLRWRIEHVQVLAPSDVPRLAQLDIIASMQPIHATSDGPWATDRVGPKRIKGAYAWRSLLNHKTVIASGSDAPVEDINPLWGIYAAITRQDHDGKPADGWHPEQNMTREEALKSYTLDAAYAAFRENELGSLKAGKLADLIVLPKNILTCDPKDLISMKVLYTIVGGQIRHHAK